MNQKGIVWMPIIIWTIIISGTVFIAQDAVKKGYIDLDSSSSTPSPQPTTFPTLLPTYKPTPIPIKKPPQGQVQGVTSNNQNTQTTQGRTGKIVKYKEYCKGGKEISVYESELITKKAADGNIYSMTKDDWDCSERDSKQRQNPPAQSATINCYDPLTTKTYQVTKETCDKWVREFNQNKPTTEPTINCVLSHGTYQLTQASCDSFKANDKSYTPPQYYPCTLCNSYDGTCTTYDYLYKTKKECEAEQQKRSQEAESIINQHNSQVESCRSRVGSLADYQQRCTAYGGSAAEACRQITKGEWQAAYDACGTKV